MARINSELFPQQAVHLMQILGGSEYIRIVGGAIRNAMFGAPVNDIDMATILTPNQVQKKLSHENIKVIPTGIDHGTVTAVVDDIQFEITTLRSDIETDGRHAVVSFTDDWRKDAQRRDFTVNALYCDEKGIVFDPLEQGIDDVQNKRLRFIGDASQRIKEDYLRILRYYRFYAQYDFERLAPDERLACKKAAQHILSLSRERVTQEWFKMLVAPRAVDALRAMYDDQVMIDMFKDAKGLSDFARLHKLQINFHRQDVAALLLALDVKQDVIGRYFILPNKIKNHMQVIEKAKEILSIVDEKSLLLALYRCGKDATLQALLCAADRPDMWLDFIAKTDIPMFPVTGKMLIDQGYKQGKALGDELKRQEALWIENGFKAI